MKRYRVLGWDFDSRPLMLTREIQEAWGENAQAQHRANKERLVQELSDEFGSLEAARKLKDFADLGPLPFSVWSFHNKFLHQIRIAFVMGSYYPALAAACALGERILNDLILLLRDDFSGTPEYKKVYNKDSFDNWLVPIKVLESWDVFLPPVAKSFKNLWEVRKREIHFKPETATNDRALALEAVGLLNEIIGEQFSGFGPQPWFITGVPGECYLKKEAESQPFIKRVYLPNCVLVSPFHTVYFEGPGLCVKDSHEYANKDITDDEFVELRKQGRERTQASRP